MKKLAVVTGGTKGIGRELIHVFAANHFDIVTCSRNRSEVELLAGEITATYAVKVIGVPTDLTKREQIGTFVDEVRALGRPVDVLVNNAGFFIPGRIVDEPEGNLNAMIEANLYSAYHVTRGLVTGMIERKSGHIFNMCSIASFTAYANGGSYAISKFAMLGFSRCLREELKPSGIRVTRLCPEPRIPTVGRVAKSPRIDSCLRKISQSWCFRPIPCRPDRLWRISSYVRS